MSILADPALAALFYGCFLLVAVTAAYAGGNQAHIKLALISACHWLLYNAVILTWGFDTYALIVGLSCLAGTLCVWLAHSTWKLTALHVALWLTGAAITTFYYFNAKPSWVLFALLNLTFLGRMLSLVGAGTAELVGWSWAHRHGAVLSRHGDPRVH